MSKTKKIISLLLTVALIMTMATVAIVSTSAAAKVYFEDSLNWGSISAYCFGGDGELLGGWPGTACTDEGNGIWSIEVDGTPEAIIFNGGGTQTANIPFAGDAMIAKLTGETVVDEFSNTVYVAEFEAYGDAPVVTDPATDDEPVVTEPADDVPATGAVTIRFSNNKFWGEVMAHYWGTESTEWPGVAMTKVDTNEMGEDIYEITLPAGTTGVVINNNDNGEQTLDIVPENGTGYYPDGDATEGKYAVGTYTFDAPVVTDPATDDEPVVTEPKETEPKPVVTEPKETEPKATEPKETEPKPVVTEPKETEPVVDDKKGVEVAGTIYEVAVGDTITYTVTLKAAELFEDTQAIVTYDADKLEIITSKGSEGCPNLPNGLVFNSANAGTVKFNASFLEGFDFTEEKAYVTLQFTVKDDAYSAINLTIEEMTLLNGDSYFTDGDAVITDGITVTETLDVPVKPTEPKPTEPKPTEPKPVVTDPKPVVTDPKPVVTEPINSDATSNTDTTTTDKTDAPNTGATAYIYIALAIVAMAAAAVVVLRKKANG